MDNLLGLVLCGGESRRMGRDKGLLLKDGTSWARHMGQKLSPWAIPVVYSINASQRAAYSAILPPEQLIIDTRNLPGPLNGLFTTHRHFPHHDIFLLACDMLDMDESTLQTALACYEKEKGQEFFVYEEDGWLQPFGGIYTAAGLDRVGAPADGSLQALLKAGQTRRLHPVNPAAFANYNSL